MELRVMEKLGIGKKALVTGASRGIGKGIALVMANEGYDLAISYSTQKDEAEQVAHIIETEYGRKCFIFQANMSEEETPRRLVDEAVKALGRMDVLVNNAGITLFDWDLGDDIAKINLLINIDFRGYFLAADTAAKHMIAKKTGGNIINITSSRAERAYPEDAVYGGLKAAMKRTTESLALKYAPYHIRVNCIAPGATVTRDHPYAKAFYKTMSKKIPLGRIGTPEDVGNAVAWLASDKASYITGITLRIDGGLILPGIPENPPRA
jgi:glucose 1-dehydrogenase